MILVVDDDEGGRATYEYWLRGVGTEVRGVADGHAALEALGKFAVSTVLLDLYMPGMEGIETLRHIKKQHPHIRIIVMSGMRAGGCDMLRAAVAFGADGVLEKPFSLPQLLSLIDPKSDTRSSCSV